MFQYTKNICEYMFVENKLCFFYLFWYIDRYLCIEVYIY